MIRRLLCALRLDDVLAILFTGAFLILGTAYAAPLPHKPLEYFLILTAYYGTAFVLVRWIATSPHLSPWKKKGILAILIVLLAAFTLIAPDHLTLESLKNLLVLLVPIVLAWVTAPDASGGGRGATASSSEVRLLRDFMPFLVSQAAYLLLHDLVHAVSPIDRDNWLIAADRYLFGGAATQWLEPFVHPWATEWFSATYSLFVFFPISLALWFAARGERAALLHLLQAVVLCNYLGYFGYLLVPAIGPMYTLHYEVPLSGGWFYQIKESLDQLARVPRDCFPSLHTANTLVVLLTVWRYARALFWIYLLLGGSCIAATIYLRYHYSVDLLAGLVLGGGVFCCVPWLAKAWQSAVARCTGTGESHP